MIKMNSSFSKTKIKYLCTSLSIPLDKESLEENGKYPVYGASGIIGMMSHYHRNTPYLGIIKDVAGVGRIGKYPAFTSLLGTLSYILPNDGIDIDWLMYAIKSLNLNQSLDKTTIPHIYFSDYGNKKINVCNLILQQKIATFLNSKCSQIDSLIADITKEIELLKEYRKSIIYEAVTKGLNPNVTMKNSGIEWICKIPAHWDVHRVSNYFSERKTTNIFCNEDNLLSLSYGRVIRKGINSNGGLLPESFRTYNIVEPLDIIIRPTDLQNDKKSLRTGLVTEHGIITSAYICLIPRSNVDSKYFHYLLHTYDIEKVFYNMGNGVRQGLNYSEFARLLVIAPPYSEQNSIVTYLDSKCSEIDAVISKKEQQIDKLTEYKKSLIYEYVTGKKEVLPV